ncbi:hypothetical protein [Pseudothermotoga thermarum]|uniref:Lipoprotein n=1 Tax=Pseudothermotoga thermarum DSM 5069 TaxID=688269 RepID=F7YVP0_9THEM|nr:hypothetical protein [Pseudothermotoga thermarum]AEH51705.1 hypothetical protein Theth_1657 [Pseudothermotoga thermarum DSM 5069]
MKGKWFLLILAALVVVALLASCGGVSPRVKPAYWHNIGEIIAKNADNEAKEIANANYGNKRTIFLWYDYDATPTGYSAREGWLTGSLTGVQDKDVYLNNVFKGNYSDPSNIQGIISAIGSDLKDSPASSNLTMYLRSEDGVFWSLVIGVGTETKQAGGTYVFVVFNPDPVFPNVPLYKVEDVQVEANWKNININPWKNKLPAAHKGYALFEISLSESVYKIVDALVLNPRWYW